MTANVPTSLAIRCVADLDAPVPLGFLYSGANVFWVTVRGGLRHATHTKNANDMNTIDIHDDTMMIRCTVQNVSSSAPGANGLGGGGDGVGGGGGGGATETE